MGLAICVECGGPTHGARCAACGAAPSPWRAEPLGVGDLLARAGLSAVMLVSAGACFLGAFALCAGWIGPALSQRVFQVVVAGVMLLFGLPVGFALLYGAFEQLFQRTWRVDEAEREGEACTLFGVLLEGRGEVYRVSAPVPFTAEALSSTAVLHALPAARAAAGEGAPRGDATPRAEDVDLVLAAAIVGLVARGQIELAETTLRGWRADRSFGAKPRRARDGRGFVLRRRAAAPAQTRADQASLEERLLALLDDGSARATAPEGGAPYRVGAARVERPCAGPPREVEELVRWLMPLGRRVRRGLLRDLRAQRAHEGPAGAASEEVCAALRDLRAVTTSPFDHLRAVIRARIGGAVQRRAGAR